jgi:hypothetical protein
MEILLLNMQAKRVTPTIKLKTRDKITFLSEVAVLLKFLGIYCTVRKKQHNISITNGLSIKPSEYLLYCIKQIKDSIIKISQIKSHSSL